MIKYIKTPFGYKRLSFFSRILYTFHRENMQGYIFRERVLATLVIVLLLIDIFK